MDSTALQLDSPAVLAEQRMPAPAFAGELMRGMAIGPNGRYQIERRLGKGGFGEAYLARDIHLDRLCVAKRLVIDPAASSQTRLLVLRNFEREARLLVTLNTPGHPNIPEIYETLPECQCLIMKYIEGQSLLRVIKRRVDPLPEREALSYIREACSALVYMHSRSPEPIVHRDIKPDNILLDRTDRIWVIDFGLGKAAPIPVGPIRSGGTRPAGTPGYAPPEQWRGAVEPRSDIYALAATLYTLLTNHPPIGQYGDPAARAQQLPPPRQLNPAIRPEVEQLILRGMAPEVEDRPTAQQFLAELEALLAQSAIPRPPHPARPPETTGFVGREDELAALRQNLATARLAVITGLAGVGKSALAATLARHTADPDKIFWYAFHQGEGCNVIIWRLAAFLAGHGQDDVWRLLHSIVQTGGTPLEVLIDYLLQLIRGQHYLICLDDVQFVESDPLFDLLLRRLHMELRAGTLALIVISRHRLRSLPMAECAPLAGLTLTDMQLLLAAHGLLLPDALALELHRNTEGNAQLLLLAIDALRRSTNREELIARLAEASDIERYLMAEVDERLGPDERDLMSAVAVLQGYAGTRTAIEAIVGRADIGRTLYGLNMRSLLKLSDTALGKEYLQHAIVQHFYYNLLSSHERQTMHRRAGAYYELEEPDMLKAAQHFASAGDYERAARLATNDVLAIINRGQVHGLRNLLEQFTPRQLTPIDWIAVAMARGKVYQLLRETALVREMFAEALTRLDALPELTGAPVLRARACRGMAELVEYESPQAALAWLHRGLEALGGADPVEQALLHLRRGAALIATAEYAAAMHALEASLCLLPEGPSDWRASALLKQGVIYCSQGNLERGLACHLRALAIYEQSGNLLGIISIRHNLGIEKDIAGDWAGAALEYQKALDLAEHLGSVKQQTELALSLGISHIKQGHFETALAYLSRCIELAHVYNLGEHKAAAQSSLADLWIRLGEWDKAEIAIAEAEQLARAMETKYQLPEIYRERAQLRVARGASADALLDAQQSIRLARDLTLDLDEGAGLRVLGQVLLTADRRAEALSAFAQSLAILDGRDPYEAARTKAQWGSVLLMDVVAEQGVTLLREALATFKALRARHDLALAERALQAGGVRAAISV